MTLDLGNVDANSTLYIPFHTFDSNGASITLTGLAVTDIEIYKNGSVTQRSSDAGYALLDTDGIDFDGLTGIHGFSIDLADNTDSGFYAAGSFYWVVVSAVTVDTRTVSFVAATFRIGPVSANVTQWLSTAAATPTTAGVPEVDVTHWLGTAAATPDTAGYVKATIKDGTGAGEIALTSGAIDNVTLTATTTTLTNLPAITSNWLTAAGTAADFTTEIQSGLATPTNITAGTITTVTNLTNNNDKTGYSLSAAGIQAVWDALTSALTTVGSIGKLIVDNLNATISSRSSHSAADVWAAGTRTLTAIDEDTTTLDLDATVRAAVGMASANLDTQLDALPTAIENADATLSRGVSNVQDTADTTSLAAIVLAILESSVSGTTWTIRKTGGTTFVTKTLTVDAAADPITGVT